ncbi:MAG: metallophosphoesterase family protein [Verrucomicrobiota bacterium]
MRILLVADLHYTLKQFDWLAEAASGHDLVVIGGDLLDVASILEPQVQTLVVEKYLSRIASLRPLMVSSGNHDGDRRSEADESVAGWLQELRGGQLYVDGDSVELEGTLFTICPWWDGPVSRAALESQLERDAARPRKRWIWIHHAPPDQSPVSWAGRRFGGDEFLPGWIEKYRPDFVFSGHIHNAPFLDRGSWLDRVGDTWVFNPGRQIGSSPTSISLNLETMVVEWTSFEGPVRRSLNESGQASLSPAPSAAGGA